jgi:alanyl-tRNA synthetase
VRLVEMGDLDRAACSGTHLSSTAELESICLTGTEQLRGGTRVFFVAGERVRSRMAAHEARNRQLRSVLGAPDAELVPVAEAKLLQLKETGRENRRLADEMADYLLEELTQASFPLRCFHFHHVPAANLRKIAAGFAERCNHGVLFLSCDALSFVLADASAEPRAGELGRAVAEILDARGGGQGALYQGKAISLERLAKARALLEELT